ncbi:pyridoxamine 5'-phosphate oxidase family protein [Lutimaribacter marinistellae]|uniref:Pyridoxamine 5'-phosphate oxidase family protein n=1 Tax=Lutimaribacter marinistellae TaxID=1820329 RepID=A0ABV7TEF6_9RHOB
MNPTKAVQDDAHKAFFDILEKERTGMLAVTDSGQHYQPMTHFCDRDTGILWFITSVDTDLVRAVGTGSQAMYTLVSGSKDFFTCMEGTLQQSQDRAKLDEIWSSVASAWFEGGKDDPKVVLLRFSLKEAAIWTATDSSVKFGFEILRANMDDERRPDVGEHEIIQINAA